MRARGGKMELCPKQRETAVHKHPHGKLLSAYCQRSLAVQPSRVTRLATQGRGTSTAGVS